MNRYLISFDPEKIKKEYHDVVIIGSGIAGVYTALELPTDMDIAILTKESIEISNSVLAQGGIAVSLDKGDSPKLHFKDTINAGAGLCDEESVWALVNNAESNIDRLNKYGVKFDKKAGEEFDFSREAAHSKSRIIHAGDTTGKEVCDKLIFVVRKRKNVVIKERTFVIDIITQEGVCRGVIVFDEDEKCHKIYFAKAVICATGGFGQIYEYTTNPEVATGDGACMAYRAGADLKDLEFIQFHPTVLFHPLNKSFLISEALRGEGAVLRNIQGKRFMENYHEKGELAPRDVVSRAIVEEMKKTKADNVFLDITFKEKDFLESRFPNIYKTCLEYGIDMAKEYIPVRPVEHYCMGGIKTDVSGKTDIEGFYACGEAACNGIHGANRLASNSLLEGLVFGYKIGQEIKDIIKKRKKENQIKIKPFLISNTKKNIDKDKIIKETRKIMSESVGIVRNKEGLLKAKRKINEFYDLVKDMENEEIKDYELQNRILLSKLIIESALERDESRGAHYRSDFNKTDDAKWKRNIVKNKKSED